jgi:hypothetical protein
MSDFLALFDGTDLPSVIADKVSDLLKAGRSSSEVSQDASFQKRLKATSDALESSSATNRALRFRLWSFCRSSFGLDPSIPLSTRVANADAADVAQYAADMHRDTDSTDQISKSPLQLPQKVQKKVKALFSGQHADFATVVGAQAGRMVAEAARNGTLSDEAKSELLARVRTHLEELPPELRDKAVEQAIKSGDMAALTLLASSTSLIGVGVAVNVAGFGAYIFAAQASAVIPLLSGPAAVSALFVLSNPLFIVPVLLGGAYLKGKRFRKSFQNRLVSTLVIQLALKGLSAGRGGLHQCLDDFKALTDADLVSQPVQQATLFAQKLYTVRQRMDGILPSTPWEPEMALAVSLSGETFDSLERALFPRQKDLGKETMLVSALTIGDIVYHAAAIDPTVLKAADFSRVEDLSNVFNFGAFADRATAMSTASHMGVENNLRGYVAEQIVAARLVEQGCQVSLPLTSNNPGFDLLVDGHEFQVKCLGSLSGLRKHFETYPDMPVLANADLASAVSASGENWTDKVFYVEGYDFETTNFIMETALESGAAIDDLDIPIFAVAVSAAKNIHGWWKGSLPLKDLPFEIVMQGAIKGSLATVGGFAGNTIGWLVFGPAGAVVFGGVGGTSALLGSNWARQQLNQSIAGDWLRKLEEATERFRSSLRSALIQKIEMLDEKVAQITTQETLQAPWFISRLSDNALTLAEYLWELDEIVPHKEQATKARECLRIMKSASVHPWAVKDDLRDVMKMLAERPSLSGTLRGSAGVTAKGAVSLAKKLLRVPIS